MIVNNLVVNNKLKLLNNSSLKDNSENKVLNGTAENTLNDENGNSLIKSDITVPSEQYKELNDINTRLDYKKHVKDLEKEPNRGMVVGVSPEYDTMTYSIYTTNGTKWTGTYIPFKTKLSCVCYGKGMFVAIATSSSIAIYSKDGINWEQTPLPTDGTWECIAYGNGKFVAIEKDYSSKAIYSEDGINWTATTMPSARYRCMCFGKDKFVAIAQISKSAAYSTDGINWKYFQMPENLQYTSVCYGGDKFVATVYGNNDIVAYSEDGITWKTTTLPVATYCNCVCYGGGKFVVACADYNSTGLRIACSEDGINWVSANSITFSHYWYSVCYISGKFIAITGSGTAIYSRDGINWTEFDGFKNFGVNWVFAYGLNEEENS